LSPDPKISPRRRAAVNIRLETPRKSIYASDKNALDAHESLVHQNGIVIVPPVQHGGQERAGRIPRRGRAGGKQKKYENQEKKFFHGFLKPRFILWQISCHNSEIDM